MGRLIDHEIIILWYLSNFVTTTNEERDPGISLFRPEPQNRPTLARTGRVEGQAGLAKKPQRGPNVAATCESCNRIALLPQNRFTLPRTGESRDWRDWLRNHDVGKLQWNCVTAPEPATSPRTGRVEGLAGLAKKPRRGPTRLRRAAIKQDLHRVRSPLQTWS